MKMPTDNILERTVAKDTGSDPVPHRHMRFPVVLVRPPEHLTLMSSLSPSANEIISHSLKEEEPFIMQSTLLKNEKSIRQKADAVFPQCPLSCLASGGGVQRRYELTAGDGRENSPCRDYFLVPRFQSSVQGPRGKQQDASG